jgi:hypothetical protein
MNDALYYFRAILLERVASHRINTTQNDRPKGSLDRFLTKRPESKAKKKRRTLQLDINRVERGIAAKKQAIEGDIEFINVFKLKANWNHTSVPFKGIGQSKSLKLIERGITTAKELIQYDGNDPEILPQWKLIVENYYENLEVEMAVLTGELSVLQEQLEWNSVEIDIEKFLECLGTQPNNQEEQGSRKLDRRIPPFSLLEDVIIGGWCAIISIRSPEYPGLVWCQRRRICHLAWSRLARLD